MASAPLDRLPLHTIILPILGAAAWLGIGKAGLGPLAIVLAAILLGNVIAAGTMPKSWQSEWVSRSER